MNTIKLESLGLEYPSEWSYTFGGEVSSVELAVIKNHLKKRNNQKGFIKDLGKSLVVLALDQIIGRNDGVCISYTDTKELIAFVKRGLPEPATTFVKGHEEAHALINSGEYNLLENQLLKSPCNREVVYSVRTDESRAHLGGVHAVLRKYGCQGLKQLKEKMNLKNVQEYLTLRLAIAAGLQREVNLL